MKFGLSKKSNTNVPTRRRASQNKSEDQRASSENLEQRYAFRRNRTITGSSSSSIFAPGEQSADLKSPRVQAHELVKKRRHMGMILLTTLCIAGAMYGLLSQFTAAAVVRATPDSSLQLDDRYQQVIDDYFLEHPIERLRFLLDEARLNRYVQAAAPEIKSLSVEGAAGIGESVFLATLRVPLVSWSINGEARYVDESGVSFARNYFSSPAVRIVDASGLKREEGQAVASNRFLEFMGQVAGMAKAKGYVVTEVTIPASATRQVELRIKDLACPVKLSIDRPTGEQVEDMIRAVEWFKGRGETPQYIDVRVSQKAFYRL